MNFLQNISNQFSSAMSLSSVPSGERSDDDDVGSVLSYDESNYQQPNGGDVSRLDFFADKAPVLLSPEIYKFSEIEAGHTEEFEISLPRFSQNDVLSISVVCIPDFAGDDMYIIGDKKKTVGRDFDSLNFIVSQITGEGAKHASLLSNVKPLLYNGEYNITLNSSNGLREGRYILSIQCDGRGHNTAHRHRSVQTVHLKYRVFHSERATPLECEKAVTGKTQMNNFQFYRFVCKDRTQTVVVSLKQRESEQQHQHQLSSGDADLFVTNRDQGFGGLTRENAVWQCCSVGQCKVEIFPDDIHLEQGKGTDTTFLIGIFGYKEVNDFELCVSLRPPVRLTEISFDSYRCSGSSNANDNTTGGNNTVANGNASASSKPNGGTRKASLEVSEVPCNRYSVDFFLDNETPSAHFSLRLPVAQCDRMLIAVSTDMNILDSFSESAVSAAVAQHCTVCCGRGVLPSFTADSEDADDAEKSMDSTSVVPQRKQQPVLYLAEDVKLPDSEHYSWSATAVSVSSSSRVALCCIETNEWKYTSGVCYLTAQLAAGTALFAPSSSSSTGVLCRLVVWHQAETHKPPLASSFFPSETSSSLPQSSSANTVQKVHLQHRLSMLNELFSDVDGNVLSQKDRTGKALTFVTGDVTRTISTSYSSGKLSSSNSTTNVALLDKSVSNTAGINTSHSDGRENASGMNRGTVVSSGEAMAVASPQYYTLEDANLTHGEIEFMSFIKLLHHPQLNAVDGQIFYDLGAGSGKAVCAAALSGIRFLKCVGIEVLPSLAYSATTRVLSLQKDSFEERACGGQTTTGGSASGGGGGLSSRNVSPDGKYARSSQGGNKESTRYPHEGHHHASSLQQQQICLSNPDSSRMELRHRKDLHIFAHHTMASSSPLVPAAAAAAANVEGALEALQFRLNKANLTSLPSMQIR